VFILNLQKHSTSDLVRPEGRNKLHLCPLANYEYKLDKEVGEVLNKYLRPEGDEQHKQNRQREKNCSHQGWP